MFYYDNNVHIYVKRARMRSKQRKTEKTYAALSTERTFGSNRYVVL